MATKKWRPRQCVPSKCTLVALIVIVCGIVFCGRHCIVYPVVMIWFDLSGSDLTMHRTNGLLTLTLVRPCALAQWSDSPLVRRIVKCHRYDCKWIRNCSTYREPMTSDALGGLAGSKQTLLYRHAAAYASKYGVIWEIRLCQSTRNLKNNLPNFATIRFETTDPLSFLGGVHIL